MGGSWSHVAYSDEANWNVGRYRSVAAVSVAASMHDRIVLRCADLLKGSSVTELGWKHLASARQRFAAVKIIDAVIEEACAGSMRVDVLMWDMEDERHKDVFRRDDVANLGRMYHHLFVNVLRSKWPDGSTWSLHPDEHSEVDWTTLERTIDARGVVLAERPDLQILRDLTVEFRVVRLVPRESHAHSLIQVADVFAGMMPYSYLRYGDFERWTPPRGQQTLPGAVPGPNLSGSDEERFLVLDHLKTACAGRKLYVSLASHRGLRTMDPTKPINFWPYEAQSEQDRAPVKRPRWWRDS
jgi:hypothetical protein